MHHQVIADINSSNRKLPYSLHIPRASLNCSSSSVASSHISRSRDFSPSSVQHKKYIKTKPKSEDIESDESFTSRGNNSQMYFVHKVKKANLTATQSSSSSGSNQSDHSVNSLLLSVKNLETFNNRNSNDENTCSNKIYNKSDNIYRKQMLENIKNILAIDNNDGKKKRKEPDQVSTSSTATNTNFTVITFNGFEKKNHKKSRAICRRRHQVTILIICMTILLFLGISSAVCMLEMRYMKMPR